MLFSYMGTKKAIAPLVAQQIAMCKGGPLLDLFCGVGCIAEALKGTREIWLNDVQMFAYTVAKSAFTSKSSIQYINIRTKFCEHYYRNFDKLSLSWGELFRHEAALVAAVNFLDLKDFYSTFPSVLNNSTLESDRISRVSSPFMFPFNLFVIAYSGTYLGVRQAAEADSLRYAISMMKLDGSIGPEEESWLLLGLCKAVSKTCTTTGHFAQYLTINSNNRKYYIKKRNINLLNTFENEISTCSPVGDAIWRSENRAYNCDAVSLLTQLINSGYRPGVIYADPPYTEDQYSRYYHLYETIIKYDYPPVASKARYRDDRYRSCFSLKTKVNDSMSKLIELCSQLQADLVLSYPKKGLLPDSEVNITKILNEHYDFVDTIRFADHTHSSFGASTTSSKQNVVELIFSARNTQHRGVKTFSRSKVMGHAIND